MGQQLLEQLLKVVACKEVNMVVSQVLQILLPVARMLVALIVILVLAVAGLNMCWTVGLLLIQN